MILLLSMVGLAVASSLVLQTPAQRDEMEAKWIKPLEAPAWMLAALIWGVLLWEPVTRALQRLF